nr:hypothetical protein [Candidatus Electrothrix aestuarii]
MICSKKIPAQRIGNLPGFHHAFALYPQRAEPAPSHLFRDIFFRKLEARIKQIFNLHLPGIEATWAGLRLLSLLLGIL